jgi:hypothetical protein
MESGTYIMFGELVTYEKGQAFGFTAKGEPIYEKCIKEFGTLKEHIN